MNIYISLEDKEKNQQLIIDGNFELFERFLSVPRMLLVSKDGGSSNKAAVTVEQCAFDFHKNEVYQTLLESKIEGRNRFPILRSLGYVYGKGKFDGTFEGLESLMTSRDGECIRGIGTLRRKMILDAIAVHNRRQKTTDCTQ